MKKATRKPRKKTMTVVIGASRLGAYIASEASQNGIYTSIIDLSPESFKKLDSGYSGYTVVGDATDQGILDKAHIQDAKEVVITTGDDNTNIFLACMIAAYYDVPYIIVRVRDEKKAAIITDEKINIISTSTLSLQAYKAIHSQEENNI